MKGQSLPAEHHVIRYVPYSKLDKDADDNPVGILFSAFQRKPGEEGLSVTWMEYFAGSREDQVVGAVQAIRASNIKPGGKSGFAIGNVGAVKAACADRKHKIRIIHWPEDDNKAHAELRQFPTEDRQLLDRLAAEVWAELVLNASIAKGEKAAPEQAAIEI